MHACVCFSVNLRAKEIEQGPTQIFSAVEVLTEQGVNEKSGLRPRRTRCADFDLRLSPVGLL